MGQKISDYSPFSQGAPNLGYLPPGRLRTSPQFVERGRAKEGNQHLLVPTIRRCWPCIISWSHCWDEQVSRQLRTCRLREQMWTALQSRRAQASALDTTTSFRCCVASAKLFNTSSLGFSSLKWEHKLTPLFNSCSDPLWVSARINNGVNFPRQ